MKHELSAELPIEPMFIEEEGTHIHHLVAIFI